MSFQYWLKHPRLRKPNKSRSPALSFCPQKKGVVIKSFDTTPRKPNSARRKTAKVRLSNRRQIHVYFEGIGLNRLQAHSVVLVRGRGPRDLPGVRYHAIRGHFDLPALLSYRHARSKYGVKKLEKDKPKKKVQFSEITSITERYNAKLIRQRFLIYKHLQCIHKISYQRPFWLYKEPPQ